MINVSGHQDGFIMISLLVLMPLFATILVSIGGAAFLTKTDQATRQQCRVELLKAQKTVADHLRQILALNPLATALRQRRLLAERALATAVTPASAAAATAALAEVIGEQMSLRARQQVLLTHARIISRLAPHTAAKKVNSAYFLTRPDESLPSNPLLTSAHGGEFPMLATPPTSLTPNYEPAPFFSRRQNMSLSWSFQLASFLPTWMRDWLNNQLKPAGLNIANLKARAECSASLEKEHDQWTPILTAAKR